MAYGSSVSASPVAPDPCDKIKALAERQACFFRVLGNPRRVLALWLLSEKPRTFDELALAMDSAPANAARHLRILKFGGLVEERTKPGGTQYYSAKIEEFRSCLVFRNRPRELLQDFEPTSSD